MNQSNIVFIIVEILALYIGITTLFYLYKFFTTTDLVKKNYKKKMVPGLVILAIFFGLWILFTLTVGSPLGLNSARQKSSMPGMQTAYMGSSSMRLMPPGYPQQQTNSITDTREFLKKSFYASIQTQKIEPIAKKVQLLIKGSDGRIDSSTVSTTNAYFSFVIPKSQLDAFEEEIRTYAHPKFYTQSISSQNLLGEKQNLEHNQDANQNTIVTLTDQQKKAQADYKKQAASINAQITTKKAQLTALELAYAQAPDDTVRMNIISQKQSANVELQTLTNTLATATASYKSQMANLGLSLADQAKLAASLATQEDTFFDKIETVEGSVSINHISLWQIIVTLSPINPALLIGIILIIMKIVSAIKEEKKLKLMTLR